MEEGWLETYDWYVYVENTDEINNNTAVDIWINEYHGGDADYPFKWGGQAGKYEIPGVAPHSGGIESDPDADLYVGQNFYDAKLTSVPWHSIKIYIVGIQAGTNPDLIPAGLRLQPFTLQVRVWR